MIGKVTARTRFMVAMAVTALAVATAVGVAVTREPEKVSVVAASSEDGGPATTTTLAELAAEIPIVGPLDQNLTCQGEMMAHASYDSLAGSGYATPEEALEGKLAESYPQAPRLDLTGRTRFLARFENDRGVFLVALLEDGLWHMDRSIICGSTGPEWSRGSALDPRR